MKTPARLPRESENLASSPASTVDELLIQSVAKLDRSALGIAVGIKKANRLSGK